MSDIYADKLIKLSIGCILFIFLKILVFYEFQRNLEELSGKHPNKKQKTVYAPTLPWLYVKYLIQCKVRNIIKKFKSEQKKEKTDNVSKSTQYFCELERQAIEKDKFERSKPEKTQVENTKQLFSCCMRTKKLNRNDILEVKEILKKNVNRYDRKKYKNDCHEIYCMLNANDINNYTLKKINKILEFKLKAVE